MASSTWIDLTIRPSGEPEVELQPDSTVELTWQLEGESRLTLLLDPEVARALGRKLELKLLLVEA